MLNNDQSVISAVAGRQVRPDVVEGLKSASEKTGVSFEFLVAQATRESGLNPSAKASTTSARGLFQFTSQTWLEVYKANGSKYGQGDLAKKIKRNEDGSLEVADPAIRKAILDQRQNPEMSALMAAEYAKTNEKRLESRLNREVGPSELYLAHFLGPNGAARFLDVQEKAPEKVAAKILPAAARHNHSVFYEGNKPRSVAAVYSQVRDSIDGTIQRMAETRKAAQEPEPQPQIVEVRPAVAPETARAEAAKLRESARDSLISQVMPVLTANLALNRGEPSESRGNLNETPRVSLPMPPPLENRPQTQGIDAGALETLMRRVRLSFLG
ncbi:MAG: transglycosylase SLT domain-containing protein [Alphaproteobacteria bacterium]|nr:transglycosylase SLT domain-containing protein [Alphaproteobacteria bacterium]